MGKNDIVFIGIAGIAAYFLLSGKGKDEGGSESGGFQIPDLFGGGQPGSVFNITFPDVPQSFNADSKKETNIITNPSSSYDTGYRPSSSLPNPSGSPVVNTINTGNPLGILFTGHTGAGQPLQSSSGGLRTVPSTTKKQSVQATGIAALKANITAQPTYGKTSGGKSTGGMGKTYTKKTYIAGKTTHAYK